MSSLLLLGAACFSLILTQSGCPGGAELEHPEQWSDRFGSGGTGTGGSGSAGTPSGPVLDFSTVDCGGMSITDPKTGVLPTNCAKAGCHNRNSAVGSSGLDLTPDDGFASRIKDKPAVHGGLICPTPDQPYAECTTPPAQCPSGALLVNSAASDSSWILTKLHGMANDCGDTMPPTGYNITPQAVTCIENIVKAVADLK